MALYLVFDSNGDLNSVTYQKSIATGRVDSLRLGYSNFFDHDDDPIDGDDSYYDGEVAMSGASLGAAHVECIEDELKYFDTNEDYVTESGTAISYDDIIEFIEHEESEFFDDLEDEMEGNYEERYCNTDDDDEEEEAAEVEEDTQEGEGECWCKCNCAYYDDCEYKCWRECDCEYYEGELDEPTFREENEDLSMFSPLARSILSCEYVS